jgi:hypothetical protein
MKPWIGHESHGVRLSKVFSLVDWLKQSLIVFMELFWCFVSSTQEAKPIPRRSVSR